MEVMEITNGNMEEFCPLLGEDLTEDMKRACYRGIGVKDEEDRPVGVMAFELLGAESEEDTKSRIFLFNAESEEAKKAMEDFYTADEVEEEEIAESRYEFPEEEKADSFREAGFSKEKKESEVIRTTLSEIGKLGIARKKRLPDYIRSIEELSVTQYRDAVKAILFKGHKGVTEDLPYLPMNWFDVKASSCSLSDGKVDGFFLVRRTPSGMLIPMLFYAFGPYFRKNLIYMLVRSAAQAVELYPPETEVLIIRRNAQIRALIGRLLPEAKGEDVYAGSRKEG